MWVRSAYGDYFEIIAAKINKERDDSYKIIGTQPTGESALLAKYKGDAALIEAQNELDRIMEIAIKESEIFCVKLDEKGNDLEYDDR